MKQHSRNAKKPQTTVGNLMLMGKEKQMRMSESTKSYLSLFPLFFPAPSSFCS